MVTLNDLSDSELQYLRSKWNSEQTELSKERARKIERLNARLEDQDENSTALIALEAQLAHAQAVMAQLQSSGAAPELIAAQQAVVDGIQDEINAYGLGSAFVSNTDAMLAQMEFDELEFAAQKRTDRMAEIDALLA